MSSLPDSPTHSGATLEELEASVKAAVNAVKDDPEGRYQLRDRFYDKYGFTINRNGKSHGLGNSELAFLRWEIKRGVLNPKDFHRPGSPWWRAVNLDFIYYSELAMAIHEAGIEVREIPDEVGYWLDYLQEPSEQAWYRAHNRSIVRGYQNYISLAASESKGEQLFLNEVLYRLLYAQAMVENTPEGLGLLGKILANPRLPSVDIIVHLPDFYPDHYPLTKEDIREIRHKGHSLQEAGVMLLDELIIIPRLYKLYKHCAGWLKAHFILGWQKRNTPVYPDLDAPPIHLTFFNKWILTPLKIIWNFIVGVLTAPFRKRGG